MFNRIFFCGVVLLVFCLELGAFVINFVLLAVVAGLDSIFIILIERRPKHETILNNAFVSFRSAIATEHFIRVRLSKFNSGNVYSSFLMMRYRVSLFLSLPIPSSSTSNAYSLAASREQIAAALAIFPETIFSHAYTTINLLLS